VVQGRVGPARRTHEAGAFGEHAPLVEELLDRIRTSGPMSSTDLAPRPAIDWYWRPTNQVRALLEALAEAGVLGLSRRDGNRRVYDLVERLFPSDALAREIPVREGFRHKLLSRHRAHGLLGTGGSAELWWGTSPRDAQGFEDGLPIKSAGRRALHAELVESGTLVPVAVDGIGGLRFVPAAHLPTLAQAKREVAAGEPPGGAAPGVAFLAALDPLVWDRDLLRSLYDFDYIWEVYVPAAKRRWGYYVLPILFGDRIVGRIEPRIERKANELRIAGLWWEDPFDPVGTPGFLEAFRAAVEALRAFGGVARVAWPRVARHRGLVRAVRTQDAGRRRSLRPRRMRTSLGSPYGRLRPRCSGAPEGRTLNGDRRPAPRSVPDRPLHPRVAALDGNHRRRRGVLPA